ncbi:MAG: ExeM/NucH family extracellular endonuclease [Candidatus Promineofilum sp.]|nr:ExeM/NucH family extracellular endonuclease [Promineifilum sp.]
MAANTNITITFSETVVISGTISVLGSSSGPQALTPTTTDNLTFTLPHTDFTNGETVTVTIDDAQVEDQDATDPPGNLAADFSFDFTIISLVPVCDQPFTPIYDIQGSGATAAITGNVVTEGIVVGDFQTSAGILGFYIQDAAGDGDTATSDGIFVVTGATDNTVSAGDSVHVTAYAREQFGQTTLNGSNANDSVVPAANIVDCGDGSVTPIDVTMPFASTTDPERYEGMLVRFPQTLVIAEYFNYDQFGEVVLALPLAGEDRPHTPTSVVEPGAPAIARAAENAVRRITLDDNQAGSNPAVLRHPNGNPFSLSNMFRGGDQVANTTGVLGYGFSLYRVHPTAPADYTAVNPRPASPDAVGGSLTVAAMNTLNFFITPDYPSSNPLDNDCGPSQNLECRGHDFDQPTEFTRQRDKLLEALAGLDADVIGLNEIENTTGVEPLGDPTNGIVAGLNAMLGAGTYAYIDTGVIGTDAIRVGLIYKPAAVTPVGAYQTLDSSDDPRFASNNRPALAQTFEEVGTGARFTVAVNHLKSKGSACSGDPDIGDGQGNCNQTRLAAAQALVDWLATDPTGSGDPDFLIMGDLNSYAMEDPIDAIKLGADDTANTSDDYVNLIAQYEGLYAYSYTFDGQAGYLDHALAINSLASQVTGATEWHINSDEPDVVDYDTTFKPPAQEALYEDNPYRSSDHDAALIGLNLTPPPDTTAPNTTITNNPTNPSNSNSAFFQYTSSEGGNQFECQLDGTGWTDCDGNQVTYGGLTDGSHTFEVRAIDAANNTDPTPASYTWVIDTTGPTVTINQAAGQADPTGSSPINFTVVFSEPVTGFNDADVTLSGTAGATTAVVTGSGTTYNVAVSGMTGSGTVIATIAANVAEDALGNDNAASTSTDNTVTYNAPDTTAPTVTINQAAGQADPTSASPINFTVVFSEPVTGFTDADVTLSGTAGATTAIVTGSGTTYNVAVSGMTNDGTVIATVAANVAEDAAGNGNAASTSTDNTVTYVVPVAPTDIYVSTSAAGTVGALSYGSEDILKWDGSAWSVWFDGSDAGLVAKNAQHNINAFYIPEVGDEVLIAFAQNARVVPGIPGKVDGMDIVRWDGSAFSLVFDGQDVGLTQLTNEKIDGLHELDPALAPAAVKAAAGGSCVAYYLISPAGNGKVTNYDGTQLKISGEDVLGFCATQLGSTTAGKWHKLLDGKAEGVKPNAITSISASDDGQTLYFTTNKAFNVDSATGGHSMVYKYDMASGQFSGPFFSAPANGLTKMVDGLHVDGDLP